MSQVLILDSTSASALRGIQRVEQLMNGDEVDESLMDMDDDDGAVDESVDGPDGENDQDE